jgi:hypothetical protein
LPTGIDRSRYFELNRKVLKCWEEDLEVDGNVSMFDGVPLKTVKTSNLSMQVASRMAAGAAAFVDRFYLWLLHARLEMIRKQWRWISSLEMRIL